jgi:NADPH:quinone reductase-like Zn-dependent oxidoreductase
MKAIYITEFGGPEVMQYVELPDPATVGSQVVLDVTAIGINYADTHQTENSYLAQQKFREWKLWDGCRMVREYWRWRRRVGIARRHW